MKLTHLKKTCGACPSQWEAFDEVGNSVYIRYRHGSFSVDIDGEEVFRTQINRMADGSMDDEEMLALVAQIGDDGPTMKDQVLTWGYESVEDFYAQTSGKWEF